jgi:hypothetical protein
MGSTSSAAVYKVQLQGSPPQKKNKRNSEKMFTVSKPSQTLLRSPNEWHLLLLLLVLFPRIRLYLSLSLSLGEGAEGLSAFKRRQCPVQKILEKGVMGFIDYEFSKFVGVHQNHDIFQSFTISHRCTHTDLSFAILVPKRFLRHFSIPLEH